MHRVRAQAGGQGRLRLSPAAILAVLISTGGVAGAETQSDLQQWTVFGFNHPLSDPWAFSVWSQVRFVDDISRFDQFLLNPGFHYKTSPSTWLGFGYQYHYRTEAADEHEPWQEFVFSRRLSKTVVGNRARLKQRFIDDVDGLILRLRYRLLASRQHVLGWVD